MKVKQRTVYKFKITLVDGPRVPKPNPYSMLAIRGDQSLSTLAKTIVKSFKFDYDHCYGFYDNLDDIYKSEEIYEIFTELPDIEHTEGAKGVYRIKISKVFTKIGKKMLFLFDYGDGWKFVVRFDRSLLENQDSKYPLIIKTVGNLPEQYPPLDEGDDEYEDDDWFHEDCPLCRELKEQGVEMKWYPDDPDGEDFIN